MIPTPVAHPRRPTVRISQRELNPTAERPVRELAELLADVLAVEGVADPAEVGLHLVDEDEIAALNASHMGIEGPTDVLSFPVDGVGEGADLAGRQPAIEVPGAVGLPVLVGDVVLCASVAQRNAPGHTGSLQSELHLLVVHSALHLCGWDHDSPDRRDAMWSREREHMERLGVSPPRDPWVEP